MTGLERAALAALRLVRRLMPPGPDHRSGRDSHGVRELPKRYFLVDDTLGAPPELQMLNEIAIHSRLEPSGAPGAAAAA
jgi:hypothetical protein